MGKKEKSHEIIKSVEKKIKKGKKVTQVQRTLINLVKYALKNDTLPEQFSIVAQLSRQKSKIFIMN